MNNYDDPRWYEQHPEHHDVPVQSVQQPSSFTPNVQQPPNSEYSSYPPYPAYPVPGAFQQKIYPQECAWNRRSEEHTSELRSHHDLVCRLLLEKKKKKKKKYNK